jgi:hypothetical protein
MQLDERAPALKAKTLIESGNTWNLIAQPFACMPDLCTQWTEGDRIFHHTLAD